MRPLPVYLTAVGNPIDNDQMVFLIESVDNTVTATLTL